MSTTKLLNLDSPSQIALPVLASLACLLCIPAAVIHIQARNCAATVLILGAILLNLFTFVNALLWPVADYGSWWQGYGLCDIEVKLYLGVSLAIDGAVASIFRQLAKILDTENTVLSPGPAQKRHRIAFEVICCLVIPIFVMIGHAVVQTQRYTLYAISGCIATGDRSWLGVVLVLMWPPIICAIAAVHCGIATYRLFRYQRQRGEFLSNSHSRINQSRFIRLFSLSAVFLLMSLPNEVYVFSFYVMNVENQSFSWRDTHIWTTHIQNYPTPLIPSTRWIQIGVGYAAFAFFGFGGEARTFYRSLLVKLGIVRV